jgi:hypothetical protein
MGSTTATSSRVALQVTNSVTQTSIAKCTIQCDQVLSNNTVIIESNAVVGNILFENICVIKDASCMINQNIDSAITNILNASVDQASLSTQPVFSLTYNTTKSSSSLDEVMSNQISQMVSSNCTIATNQELNNNYVYVGNNAKVGDISFVQHSTLSNVECSMDIAAKSDLYNEGKGKVKQRATTIDTTSIVIIAIILIIVIIVIFVVVFLIKRGKKILGTATGAVPVATPVATAIPVAAPVSSRSTAIAALPLPPTARLLLAARGR